MHVPDVFPIELTVYRPNELRRRPKSSTDGKPIVRIRDSALRTICQREHAELWQRYLADGSTPSMADILAAEESDDADASLFDALDIQTGSGADLACIDGPPLDPMDDTEDDVPDVVPADDTDEDEDEDAREPRIRRPRCGRQRYRVAKGDLVSDRSTR